MPKPSQGIATAEGSKRIDINYLFKNRLIIKDRERSASLSFSNSHGENTGNISIVSHYTNEEKALRLIYTFTDHYTGIKTDIDYKVQIVEIPSNLGKGFNYYFLCPFSNRKCKILYSAYSSHYFKSRYAYSYPIYYDCQVCSKRDYSLTRYFKLKDRFDKLIKNDFRESYMGKKTKSFDRIEKLKNKVNYYDYLRWMILESYLAKKGF